MARWSHPVRTPTPGPQAGQWPPTPYKPYGTGFSAELGDVTIDELADDTGEVMMVPREYEDREDVEADARWRSESTAKACYKTTEIYRHIEPHVRLARFVRPDDWTGLPILAKPTGPVLEALLEDHRHTIYHRLPDSTVATAKHRIHDRFRPLMYRWALQLAIAIAHVHSYGLGETSLIKIAIGEIGVEYCWLSSPGLSLSFVGFLTAAYKTPGGPAIPGDILNVGHFNPLWDKHGEDHKPTPQTDLFMWANVVYELMTGHQPGEDQGLSDQEIPLLIERRQWPGLENEYLGDVVHRCWNGDVASAADLVSAVRDKIARLGWQIEGEDELVGFDADDLFQDSEGVVTV